MSVGRDGYEGFEQFSHASMDVVANDAHHFDRLRGGVLDAPVLVLLAWINGTSLSAAHRYDDIGGANDDVGEWLESTAGFAAMVLCFACLGWGLR